MSFAGVRYDHLCPHGTRLQGLIVHHQAEVRRVITRLEDAEDHFYSAITRYRHELAAARRTLDNERAKLASHVAHCTDGCQRTKTAAFAGDAQQGMWDRAPSHTKPPLPGPGALAAMIATGQTVQGLGLLYDRHPSTIAQKLFNAGYSTTTGKPRHTRTEPSEQSEPLPADWYPPWMDDALCAQTDPEAFFPEKGGSTREAKAVCGRCPVTAECLAYALDAGERFGIFGGLSERERRKITKAQAHNRDEVA